MSEEFTWVDQEGVVRSDFNGFRPGTIFLAATPVNVAAARGEWSGLRDWLNWNEHGSGKEGR